MTQDIEMSSDVQSVRSLSLSEAWLQALTQPSVATYQDIVRDPQASSKRAYGWLASSAALGFLISSISAALWGSLGLGESPGGASSILCGLPVAVLFVILGVAIMTGILNLIAHIFGGEGVYNTLLYAIAVYTAPLSLIGSLIGAIPVIGVYLALMPGLYGLVLNVIAVKAVHKFEWWKAVVSSVVVLLGLFVIVSVLVIMMLILLGPAIQEVFESAVMDLQ